MTVPRMMMPGPLTTDICPAVSLALPDFILFAKDALKPWFSMLFPYMTNANRRETSKSTSSWLSMRIQKNKRWKVADKQLVVDVLTEKAQGM